jgi:hypothetical protein
VASTKTVNVVRDAATGSVADSIARSGLAARGVIYLLVGWVALLLAFGRGRGEANQRGALRALAGEPYGAVGLWVLVAGFTAYALWRISEAFLGVTGEGSCRGSREVRVLRNRLRVPRPDNRVRAARIATKPGQHRAK